MIAHKKKFSLGVGMLMAFAVVLAIIFSPVFGGQNALNFLDDTYNSISKGSAYYIPEIKEKGKKYSGVEIAVTLNMLSDLAARQTALLFEKAGTTMQITGPKLAVRGDLGKIFDNCLEDAERMYHNDGRAIQAKYDMNERVVLYNWHDALKAMEKDLNLQKRFKEANMVGLVSNKAVDLAYNYYSIEPKNITDSLRVVICSLIFYVVYTLWFGFSILFMFEGWGMHLEH